MMITHTQKNKTLCTPKLRFKGFNGSWSKKRLGDFFIQHKEKTTKNKQYPVLTSSQVGIFLQKDYFAGKDIASEDTTGYNVVPRGYFTYRHMSDNLVFKFNINTIVDKGIVSTLYPVFTTKGIDNNFLLLALNEGKDFKKYAILQKQGGSRTYMYYSKLKELRLNLPDLPEQQKVASFFDSVDIWLNQLRKEKELLQRYKKGVVQKIFSQKISFKDKNGKKFSAWSEVKLKEILKEHKTRNTQNTYAEVFSVAKTKGVINQIEHLGRSYSAESLSNYKVIFPGDVVYTKSPTADFPFGIIKQNQTGRTGVVSTLYAVFTPVNSYMGKLLDEYFKSWINTYNYLNPLVQKGAKNTLNIGNSDFLDGAKLAMPVSDLEQKMIVEFIESIDRLIEAKEKQIVLAETWKRGMLQQLFI